jgi:Rrf2 family protein
MISQKAKYALRALVSLAQAPQGEPVFISDIADQQSIPKKFLEQILLDLKRHGILVSRRGKFGGYQLLKDPASITFGSILRIIDGPIAPLPCLSKMAYQRCADCKSEGNCEIRRVFAEVAEATRNVLDKRTIADAVNGGVPIPAEDVSAEFVPVA